MRIESALFSSREGINAHGQAIAVIGDNISNANTIGFRASRIEFGDLVAEGGSAREGGTLPTVGNGVAVQSIRPLEGTGVIENTGRDLDVAIEGRGFLTVGDPNDPYYTRAGNLAINEEGLLINSNGFEVLGYNSDGTLGTLNVTNLNLNGKPTSAATVLGNLDSQLELATAPTNPETFQALNSAASHVANMTVYDSLGAAHDITLAFFKTSASAAGNTFTVQAYVNGADVGGTEGVPTQLGSNATLTFGTDGKIADASASAATITAAPSYTGGAAAGNFTVNFSDFTQFAGPSQLSTISQDGQGSGNIVEYQLRKNGEFYANLDNGQSALIGTIRLADFANIDGLQRAGNGLYIATEVAGERRLGVPGESGLGTLAGESLERSTVDIANQFVDLVLYQRGYQASSQTLNATNALIRDTILLVR